ncbi:MAG: hypothetical protein V4692_13305 [Bdellovibrionota bacterium]
MAQRQRGQRKSHVSDAAMNDETAFDAWIDSSTDSRLVNLQENLIVLETMAVEAAERFLPLPLLRKIKNKIA